MVNKIFANAGTDLDLTTDVVSAIDTLINERAYESGLGRWEYIQSLTEIDGSHWNKILNGKAGLSGAKFRLLCKILSRSGAETNRLTELYDEYRKERRKSQPAPVLKQSKAGRREMLEELAAKHGQRLEDLNNAEALGAIIISAIRRERVRGNSDVAEKNGQLLISSLNSGLFSLHPDIADTATMELLASTAYAAYQSGNKLGYKFILDSVRVPETRNNYPVATEAMKFHLVRRYQEEFLNAPPDQLIGLQDSALEISRLFKDQNTCLVDFGNLIEMNKVRLKLELGIAHTSDLNNISSLAEKADTTGILEHQVLYRVYLAQWHKESGDIQQANYILERCISELDRKIGQMDWARCKVREMQARVAEQEFYQSGRTLDGAETVDGFFTDSIHCAQRCGNEIVVRRLKANRQAFRDRSGHF
ncbi:hypothetical protein [Roseibium litorale]|uniref:Uncharacterized protein n=1 Tax=Roseibium litorale TaxID=2803841 RepID=A0ABR9CIL2_9HYPH|nr:hypothetical protein [Roseibium litorale]MBD8890663.1 hypothetical protein [Roseibium litorale]